MGYRTSIKNINSIGHLIEGNVYTFLKQATSSGDAKSTTIEFLDRLIRSTSEQFYMSDKYWRSLQRDLYKIRKDWRKIKRDFEHLEVGQSNLEGENNLDRQLEINSRLLNFLKRISKMFSRCKVKAVLLPGFNRDDRINNVMVDENVLKRIIDIHPGDSALILQFTERFNRLDNAILNVFSKFETALNEIDNWAGVLLWNENDSLFLPVRYEEDLYDIFQVIKFEDDSFHYLRQNFGKKYKQKKYSYFFHLSDLHFGNKLAEKRMMRVVRVLENQMQKLEENASVYPIITGDLMNSPSILNKQIYLQFSELLLTKGFEKPIYVLGNHDVDTSGLIKLLTTQKSVISSLASSSKIELLDDLGLAIIKFDSNTGGELAQGKIGEDQLMQIGNEIDAITNKDYYTFIALLHHHPKEIENPNWYSRDWYEYLLGKRGFEKTMKLVDADLFLDWLSARGIKYVMHGHKHIPKIHSHEDITIIAAGSSTGSVKHQERGKTYLTYNLIKYDIEEKRPVWCSIVAEEILGAGTKNILLHLM